MTNYCIRKGEWYWVGPEWTRDKTKAKTFHASAEAYLRAEDVGGTLHQIRGDVSHVPFRQIKERVKVGRT